MNIYFISVQVPSLGLKVEVRPLTHEPQRYAYLISHAHIVLVHILKTAKAPALLMMVPYSVMKTNLGMLEEERQEVKDRRVGIQE